MLYNAVKEQGKTPTNKLIAISAKRRRIKVSQKN